MNTIRLTDLVACRGQSFRRADTPANRPAARRARRRGFGTAHGVRPESRHLQPQLIGGADRCHGLHPGNRPGIRFTSGSVSEGIRVDAQDSGVFPIRMDFDIAGLLTGDSSAAALNAVKNFVGIGTEPSQVTLQIKAVGESSAVTPFPFRSISPYRSVSAVRPESREPFFATGPVRVEAGLHPCRIRR